MADKHTQQSAAHAQHERVRQAALFARRERFLSNGPPHPAWALAIAVYLVLVGTSSALLMVAMFPYQKTTITAAIPGADNVAGSPSTIDAPASSSRSSSADTR